MFSFIKNFKDEELRSVLTDPEFTKVEFKASYMKKMRDYKARCFLYVSNQEYNSVVACMKLAISNEEYPLKIRKKISERIGYANNDTLWFNSSTFGFLIDLQLNQGINLSIPNKFIKRYNELVKKD